MITAVLCAGLLACCPPSAASTEIENDPRELVERGLRHMGGAPALRAIERARFEFITQWQITPFAEASLPERVSYEVHTDVRDYGLNAWRNTRRVPVGAEWRTMVDLVRGDVAVRNFGRGFAPLSIAYVDERDELFAYTPDRLMLAAADARALRAERDTVIGGLPHARIQFDSGRLPLTLFLRRADGLPTLVRFRAAAPNDFGLVPWGEMDVEVWYSQWTPFSNDLMLPAQWDVRRVGRAYKRITITHAEFNRAFAADSFAVSDALREAFHQTATKPMHDVPLDSARVAADDPDFIEFRTSGAPVGAVRVGGGWILLETGQAPLSLKRALDWMAARGHGPVELAIAGAVATGNGGAAAAATRGLAVHVGPGARPIVERVLMNHGRPPADARSIDAPAWLRIGTDSVLVERLDLPNAGGSIILWVPGKRWIWAPDAASPLDLRLVRERAAVRNWNVTLVGNRRMLRLALP